MGDSKLNLEKIVYLVGLALVVLTGAGVAIPQAALAIALLGAVGGYFASDRKGALVTAIAVSIVAGGMNAVPTVGPIVGEIMAQLGNLLNSGAIVIVVLAAYEKATS